MAFRLTGPTLLTCWVSCPIFMYYKSGRAHKDNDNDDDALYVRTHCKKIQTAMRSCITLKDRINFKVSQYLGLLILPL